MLCGLGPVEREKAAGYRDDWRGALAYLFNPEAWTNGAFALFLVAVAAFVITLTVDGATGAAPILNVLIRAVFGYWLVARPVGRVIERRGNRVRSRVQTPISH